MYTAFYGLREKPFALSPDPRFLYLAGSHREALAHLLYGIEQGEGFISVTGEVGTGKTTLCRTLLERLDGDTQLAFLFNPSRTALELLQSICTEFDLPGEGRTRRSPMTQLNAFLVEQKRLGRRVLLIIDEAQTLSENTLEQVRLLSNLETSREKLIQILLLGQPELDRKLDGRGLRQLRQRISVRWKLEPLNAMETRAYVRHRLSIAAGSPKDLFSEAALRVIHRRAGGVPRLINQLCDRALLAGYAARAAQIRPALVRAAAREIPDARRGRERSAGSPWTSLWSRRPLMLLAATIALVGGAFFAEFQVGRDGLMQAIGFDHAEADSLSRAGSTQSRGARNADEARVVGTPPEVGAGVNATSISAGDGPRLATLRGFVPSESVDDLRPASFHRPDSRAPEEPGSAGASIPDSTPALVPDLEALSPGLLPRLLANRSGALAMAESQRAILEGFGRRVPALGAAPRNVTALQFGIESRGLTTTSFDRGSIDLLRRLDHPVLLPLTPATTATDGTDPTRAASQQRWLAITGLEDDRARVAGLISNRIVTISIDELAAHWLEMGIIVWERFDRVPAFLNPGEEGRGVLWLQRALAELRYFDGYPNGLFDDQTRAAVTRFQREHRLDADGIAGPLTQIALYGQLHRYPVPRLSRAGPSQLAPASSPMPVPSRAEAAGAAGDHG
jgi:general secretion pathway protein A